MPVNQSADYILGGKPFMLNRTQFRGRAWIRSGRLDSPSQRGRESAPYGELPSEIDHVEVWDDWSGGFGDAYRSPDTPNKTHWTENMETRFPRQMVHCQQLRMLGAQTAAGGSLTQFDGFLNIQNMANAAELGRLGAGGVLLLGDHRLNYTYPTNRVEGLHQVIDATGSVRFMPRAATWGSFIYLPITVATQYTRINRAGNIAGETHGMPGYLFAVAGDRLWRVHGPEGARVYIQSCADRASTGLVANWSATLTVGQTDRQITDIATLDDQVYLGRPDGLWAGDQAGSFVNVLPGLEQLPHNDNARDLTIHENAVIVPTIGGVYRYDPASQEARVREIGPSILSNRGPVRGHIRATRAFGRWLLAGLWTGTHSYLLAGHDASPGLPYVWHVQQRFPNIEKVNRIHVDAVTVSSGGVEALPNRMWIAMDRDIEITGTSPVYRFEIPRLHGNPLDADPAFSANYNGSARVDLGRVDARSPGTPKLYRSVEVWADQLASGHLWCDVYYQVDGGTRTRIDTAVTSPLSVLYFTTNPFVTGQSVELSLESFTATFARSPIYRAVVLRSTLRPRSVDLITAVSRIADNMKDRRGTPMRPGATMLKDLRDFAVSGTPQQLIDLSGATSWVAVLAPVEEQETYQEGDRNPEVAATVKMAVLNFS